MNIYELEKLVNDWCTMDAVDLHGPWPRSIPKRNRTLAYMDKCEVAKLDYDRHCRNNFMRALAMLKRVESWSLLKSQYETLRSDARKLITELEDVK